MAVNALRHLVRLGLTAADPNRLAEFYEAAFGFTRLGDAQMDAEAAECLYGVPCGPVRYLRLGLGGQEIELVGFARGGAPYPDAVPGWSPLFQHFAMVVADMPAADARLRALNGWHPISQGGPQRLPERSGGVTAYKFRDPEGHPLELLAFPPGGTPEPWQHGAEGAVFLGIDHTAISVSDTARSRTFYEEFGFRVSTQSHNHGPEQARLDDLDAADVAVTGLNLPDQAAPHVELLGYHGAFDRSAAPPACNDVASARIVFEADTHALRAICTAHAARLISTGLVRLPDGASAVILRDPDGHAVMLTTPA